MPIMGSTLIGAGGVILVTVLQAAASTGGETPLPDYSATETSAQAQAKAAAFHHRLDSNGDGYVTRVEVAAYANRRNGSDQPPRGDASETLPEAAEQAFAQGDADHDGRISLNEALAGAKQAFDAQDANHDGVVTPAERLAFLQSEGSSMLSSSKPTTASPAYATDMPAGAEGWQPPAQAIWTGQSAPIAVTLTANAPAFEGTAVFQVQVAALREGVAISQFLQVTRGIDLLVTSMDGKLLMPAEPMVGAPPPPPLEANALTPVSLANPFQVTVSESTRTVFPKPGTYHVRALVTLFDPLTEPGRHARAISEPITVTVTR